MHILCLVSNSFLSWPTTLLTRQTKKSATHFIPEINTRTTAQRVFKGVRLPTMGVLKAIAVLFFLCFRNPVVGAYAEMATPKDTRSLEDIGMAYAMHYPPVEHLRYSDFASELAPSYARSLSQTEIVKWAEKQVPRDKASTWLKTVEVSGHPIVLVGEYHDLPVDSQQLKNWAGKRQAAWFAETAYRDKVFESTVKELLGLSRNALVFGIEGYDSFITDLVLAAEGVSQDSTKTPAHVQELAMRISLLPFAADFWSDFCKKDEAGADLYALPIQVANRVADAIREGGMAAGLGIDISKWTSPKYQQLWIRLFMQLARHAVDYFTLPSDVEAAVLGYLDNPMSMDAWKKYFDKVNIEFRDQMIVENILQVLPTLPTNLPVILRVGGDHIAGVVKGLEQAERPSESLHDEL